MTWWASEKNPRNFKYETLGQCALCIFFPSATCQIIVGSWNSRMLQKSEKPQLPWCHSALTLSSPQTSPHLPPSSQVAGTPVFQLQILPLAAVDIDTQREVTINRKERQGGWALMISHEHLGGRKGTGWDGGKGSYKYVTRNSCFLAKRNFISSNQTLSERLFSHSLIAEQQRPFPEGRSVPRATIHQDSAQRPLATNPPWSSPSQRSPPRWDTPSCPLSSTGVVVVVAVLLKARKGGSER